MAQSHLSELDDVQEFIGFATNPAPLLVAQYERIAREEMQALPFYQRMGFTPFARAVEVFDDIRLTGELEASAGPHVPLIRHARRPDGV